VLSACEEPALRQILQAYWDSYQHLRPFTTGKDLRAFGLPPSPRYETILEALKNAWLDQEIQSEAEEKILLKKLLEEV